MEVSSQPHAPAALPPGKKTLVPIDRRLGGLQSRSERSGKQKNSRPPPGIERWNADRPARTLNVCTDLKIFYPASHWSSRTRWSVGL
jgi:hypothetical protein